MDIGVAILAWFLLALCNQATAYVPPKQICWLKSYSKVTRDQYNQLYVWVKFDHSCSEIYGSIRLEVLVKNEKHSIKHYSHFNCKKLRNACSWKIPGTHIRHVGKYIVQIAPSDCPGCSAHEYDTTISELVVTSDRQTTSPSHRSTTQYPSTLGPDTAGQGLYITVSVVSVAVTLVVCVVIVLFRRRHRVCKKDNTFISYQLNNNYELKQLLPDTDNSTNNVDILIVSMPLPLTNNDIGNHTELTLEMTNHRVVHVTHINNLIEDLIEKLKPCTVSSILKVDLNIPHTFLKCFEHCHHVILVVTNYLLDLWTSGAEKDGIYDSHVLCMLKQLDLSMGDKTVYVVDLTTTREHKDKLKHKLNEKGIKICYDLFRKNDFELLLNHFSKQRPQEPPSREFAADRVLPIEAIGLSVDEIS